MPEGHRTGPQHAAAMHKQRTGLVRLRHATRHSLRGLADGWAEKAFRLEACLAMVLLPAAAWLGRNWLETAVLAATVVLVLVTELLNSGIEATVDRIGPEWHELSRRAKDMGSAAVLLSLLLCGATFAAAFVQRIFLHG